MPEPTIVYWILTAVVAFCVGGVVGIFTMALLTANRQPEENHMGYETDGPREGR